MKKIFLPLVCITCITLSAVSKDVSDQCTCDPCDNDYNVAITWKNGFFYPQDCTLRNIFDRNGSKGGYWVEGAFRWQCWKGLNVELSGSYFGRKGYTLCYPYSTSCFNTTSCGTSCCPCECTEVKIPTIGLGLKYFFNCADFCNCCDSCWERLSLFLGAGLRIFFYREQNGSLYVKQCVDETTIGGMLNFGIEIDVYKGFFIDLFLDYNGAKIKPDCNDWCNTCCYPCTPSPTSCGSCCPSCFYDINIGGVVGGIALGYKF